MSLADIKAFKGIYQRELSGLKVLLRLDCNVPIRNGKIYNDARLQASLPTVKSLVQRNARTMIMSHLGRPDPDADPASQKAYSLQIIADWFSDKLGMPVPLAKDWLAHPPSVPSGDVVLLENTRFYRGETENDAHLGKKMGQLCDLFVMDAFAVCHRANASTAAIMQHAAEVCPGPLLQEELAAISQFMDYSRRPVVTIAGGAKVSDKLPLLRNLAHLSDYLIPGGGIANTFLAAKGFDIGQSLHQPELVASVQDILSSTQVLLPEWVVTATASTPREQIGIRNVSDIPSDHAIWDIAPRSILRFEPVLQQAETILWNGPMGLFEEPAFAAGTIALGQLIAAAPGFSLAGGGDTLAAVERCGISEQISYLSTGGGAFLAALEGRTLLALDALLARKAS
ncbi:MAG: phosphoglycerate kinase [Gammaproteobacteria bacterium]